MPESPQSKSTERILPSLNPQNYAHRHFARVCEATDLVGHTPKDLRDTFASQLLTAGVQLGYVSAQLRHGDVAVTARHYARWIDADGYRRPMTVEDGEVPADLLARIAVPPTPEEEGRSAGRRLV